MQKLKVRARSSGLCVWLSRERKSRPTHSPSLQCSAKRNPSFEYEHPLTCYHRGMRKFIALPSVFIAVIVILIWPYFSHAESVSDQILETRTKIERLEADIAKTQKDLMGVEKEADTLANNIKALDLNQKKLESQTKLTENKIVSTNYSIEDLISEIETDTKNIDKQTVRLAVLLRNIHFSIFDTGPEVIFSDLTISEKVDRIYAVEKLQKKVRDVMVELRSEKIRLTNEKDELLIERDKLVRLKSNLVDQGVLVEANKKNKQSLLVTTKNKESNYKILLEQRIAQKTAFEKDLHDYEARLRNADLSNIPSPGKGVLAWPVDDPYITQYFGNTQFAKDNAKVYNGKGHNGVDLRASIGSAIKSVASGVVKGTGNTDLGCPGGSYGKWVLITHNNGLSSLYAHLSLVKVNVGDQLGT